MEFRKNGFNDEDAAQLGQVASMYQNVADEAISASDSASFIIAQMVAFGIEAENATHIIDAVNETANNFAVSSGQLANSLGIVSSTASAMGNSMEETIGMMVAITEQTRNSSKAARGLNSIFNNLAQVLDDASSNGKKITEIFDNLGVSMYGMDGQLLSSYELLGNLAEKWDTLDTNTKNYIASTIAGTHQLNNFLALMNNFDHAIEATETALNSAGSAARENSRYMEGLEAKTQAVKSTFQELANTVIDSGLVKGILDLANGFLQLLNTPIGAFVTQVVLLTSALWGFISLMKAMNIISVVGAQFSNVIQVFKNFIFVAKGLQGPLVATASAMNMAIPIIGALSAAVIIGIQVFDAFTVSLSEQQEIVNDLASDINNLTSEIEALQNKSNSGNLIEQEKERLSILERQLAVKERLYELENKELYNKQYGTAVPSDLKELYNKITAPEAPEDAGILSTVFDEARGYVNGYIVQLEKLEEQMNQLDPVEDAKKYNDLLEQYDKLKAKVEKTALSLEQQVDAMKESGEEAKAITPEQEEFISSVETLIQTLEEEGIILLETTDSLDETTESSNNASESAGNFSSELQNLSSAYDILTSAVEEYNTNGEFSLDTITKLLELDYDYLNALELQNGQLVLNSNELYNRAVGLKEQAKQELTAKTMTELNSIAMQDLAGSFRGAAEDASNAKGDFDGFRQILLDFAGGATTAGAAMNYLWTSMEPESKGGFTFSEEAKAAMNEVLGTYKNLMGQIDSSVISFGNASQASSSAASATKKETDVIKEQSDAFKEQNEILEHNIFLKEKNGANQSELIQLYKNYQNELHKQAEWFREQGLDDNSEYIRELQEQWWSLEDEIDSIYDEIAKDAEEAAKEAKEAWEEAMNAQIESLEKKQDAYETLFSLVSDMAQDEIDALEEQRTAVEEYWQEKIDALEQVNDELEEQIEKEEALDALARARQGKVMVYKDGRFQYVQDIDEVSEAQANLEKIEREEKLNSEIEQLEKSRDEALEILDEKIEDWEAFVDGWESILDDYEREQDLALLQEQLNLSEQELITQMENENWKTRLENLASYVQQYKDLMEQLSGLQSDLENGNIQGGASGITPGVGSLAGTEYNAWAWVPGSGYVPVTVEGGKTQQTGLPVGTIIYGDDKAWIITGGTGGDSGYTSEEYGPTPDNIWTPGKGSESLGGRPAGPTGEGATIGWGSSSSSGGGSSNNDYTVVDVNPPSGYPSNKPSSGGGNTGNYTPSNVGGPKYKYKSGTISSVGGLSLVGEDGPELRVLGQGDGILPSDITKNLWAWGAITPASMMNNIIGGLQSMGQQIGITIQNFNPNLPNVTDGQDFANYMRNNFWREAIQFAKA